MAAPDAAAKIWIQTYTGRKFYPLNPQPEHVCLEDIVHALACINRFTGHTRFPYSVAQHCMYVADDVLESSGGGMSYLPRLIVVALLHDAAEAYVGDISTPVKEIFTAYGINLELIERQILRAIFAGLGLAEIAREEWAFVKTSDRRLLATEGRDLMLEGIDGWPDMLEPLDDLSILPRPWDCVKTDYLHRISAALEALPVEHSSSRK